MIRKILVVGVLCAGCLSSLADVTIDWTANWLTDDAEVGALLQDGWMVGLYLDQNGDNAGTTWYNELQLDSNGDVVSASGPTSDDLLLTTTHLVEPFANHVTINSVNNAAKLPNNSSVYTVFFNATAIASATQIAVTGYDADPASPFNIGTPGAINTEYNAGNEIKSDFYSVPEPAVAGLIGIFGVGLIATRRIFRKDI